MAKVRDWRVGVNLIGLTNLISTVIGPNLTSCHLKIILVTPLGSKTRKLDAFGSYIPTDCSKTGLERNVFQSQNLQPWNTECVKSGALEGGLIFVAFSLVDCWQSVFLSKYFSRDYEERLFSIKENGTRHGRGTHEKKNRLQPLLMFLRIFTLVKIN